ncbi:unnamed protein product [Ambrosiozyma monospora]|uniref:Unnamed protein product n=1 Tax=Ambrosiozyma monospora TaxID=43982 RepID=A0ACB5T8V0_AMBMO|nr:unnamed protein product [Ambrosiozyma monospora]
MKTSGYSLRDQVQAFPVFQFTIISAVAISQEIADHSYKIYLWHKIKSLHEVMDHSGVVGYIGYLAAATYLPRIVSYLLWSRLSDRIGRKPILILGCLILSLSGIIYAFGKPFGWLIISKLLVGCFDVNEGVIRTVFGELSHGSDAHKVIMFSMIPIAQGLGLIFGPMVGGLITEWSGPPAADAPPETNFFKIYLFAKPNFVNAGILTFSAALVFFFFEETNMNSSNSRTDIGLLIGDKIRELLHLAQILKLTTWK